MRGGQARRRPKGRSGVGRALVLADVSKSYLVGGAEVTALEHVDLEVAQREVVTLVGPSGSGKTSLLSIAGGLLHPTSGQVIVGGQDISRLHRRKLTRFRRQRIGFIFQAVNLVPFLTARENLLLVAELAGTNRRAARKRADLLLRELGLGQRRAHLPAQLSGGERQRVAIGRALMNKPDLVLVDEPTSALDSSLGEWVMQLIVSEVRAQGAAAIIVTHDSRMTRYGDRILNMVDGRIASAVPQPEWTQPRPATIPAPAPGPRPPLQARRPGGGIGQPRRHPGPGPGSGRPASSRGTPAWPSKWWGPPEESDGPAARRWPSPPPPSGRRR